MLFTAYLIDVCKLKSQTVKTYLSAIKAVLAEDGIEINNSSFKLSALTRACKLRNDRVIARFPIHKDLLRLILKEAQNQFAEQPYLLSMYSALFSTAYFGLLRVGELTQGPHVIMVRNMHVGTNKDKILFILTSSKTHNPGDKPQRIKVISINKNT